MQAVARTNHNVTSNARKNPKRRANQEQHTARGKKQHPKENVPAGLANGFLTLKFSPVGYLAAKIRKGHEAADHGIVIESLKANASRLIDISGMHDNPLEEIVIITQALKSVAFESGCDFSIEDNSEHNDEDRKEYEIIFHRECSTADDWLAPRAIFLTHLRNTKDVWYFYAIDAVRWISNALYIRPATENSWAFENMEERIEEDRYGTDENDDDWNECLDDMQYWYDAYTSGGHVNLLFRKMLWKPIRPLEMLISKIDTLPNLPFKNALLNLLILCRNPKRYCDYDYFPHRGYYDECDPVFLYQQYGWIYTFDSVCNTIEEELQTWENEYGLEVPHTTFVLNSRSAEGLTKNQIKEQIKNQVVNDRFPDDFQSYMKDLCIGITKYLNDV